MTALWGPCASVHWD